MRIARPVDAEALDSPGGCGEHGFFSSAAFEGRLKRIALWICSFLLLCAAASRADKTKARDHFKRGMAHFVMDRYDEAIREFDAGFTEEPQPAFLYNIAQAHRKAGRPEQAIAFYKKYLSMTDDNAEDRPQVSEELRGAESEAAAK